MTDDQYKEIIEELQEYDAPIFIEAAGDIAGRPAADLRDALEILAGDDPEPLEYIRICLARNAEAAGDQERHDALLKKVHERQREQLGEELDAVLETAGNLQKAMRAGRAALKRATETPRAVSDVKRVKRLENLADCLFLELL